MEVIHHDGTERFWNDRSVMEHDDRAHRGEAVAVGEIVEDQRVPGCFVSDTPLLTVRWRMMYSSQERQVASNLCHVMMSESVPAETEELMRASVAMISPFKSSSVSLVIAESMGGETQAGAERESEYPPVTTYWSPDLFTGESPRREKVSGITFFLPGTWTGLNLYNIDLSLKFSRRGL